MAQCYRRPAGRRRHQSVAPVIAFLVVLTAVGGEARVPQPSSTTLGPTNLTWTHQDFPNPQHQPERCGRGTQGPSWVCDPVGFLSQQQADQVDVMIQEVVNNTGCRCGGRCGIKSGYWGGFKLSLAIVPYLSPTSQGTPVTADSSAQYLGQNFVDHLRLYSWRFGSCKDDMVLLYSIKDNRVFNSVGSEVRKVLKGSCESEINGEFVTFIAKVKAIQYNEVLIHMVSQISAVLLGKRKCQDTWQVFQWWHILLFSAVIAFIIVIIIVITLRIWKNRPQCLRV